MSGLISRSKLIMNLEDWLLSETPDERTDEAERDYQKIVCEIISNCIATVEEQPTVEPVRGEWIEQDEGRTKFMCSHCKAKNYDGSGKFCQSCGADMRRKVEE